MVFLRTFLLWCTGVFVLAASAEDGPRIIDLSREFPVGNVQNPDASDLESYLTRDVRRMLVLQDGEVVMDYQRDTVSDDDIYNLWSITKTVMSVIMGTIVTSKTYNISMQDTLGEIFTQERYWSEIVDKEELAFKKNVTIGELLTMTSGLTSNLATDYLSPLFFNPLEPFSIANGAGINLKESLSLPTWNATLKGEFTYLTTSNILSYVIQQVTGMSPKEYCLVDLFPSLGIGPDDYEWDQNYGGIETSFTNLNMNARQMAKFAQLYLQKGKSAPNKQLLPKEWIEESLTDILNGTSGAADFYEFDACYGYLWVGFNYSEHSGVTKDYIWCGTGLFGQALCLDYKTKRVVVIQRSNTLQNLESEGLNHALLAEAFSSDTTWEGTLAPTEAPPTFWGWFDWLQ